MAAVVLTLSFSLLLVPSTARADEPASVLATGCTSVVVDANAATASGATPVCPPAPPPPAPKTQTRWYGWQVLITDGAAVAMLAASGSGNDESTQKMLLLGSAATYLLGGPLVHAGHERAGAAGASVGLRVGAPIGGALLGYALGSAGDDREYAGLVYGALGFVGGIITASVIDSAVFAREGVVVEAPKSALRVTPSVTPTRGGATLGATAMF